MPFVRRRVAVAGILALIVSGSLGYALGANDGSASEPASARLATTTTTAVPTTTAPPTTTTTRPCPTVVDSIEEWTRAANRGCNAELDLPDGPLPTQPPEQPPSGSPATAPEAIRCGGRYVSGCHPADDPIWDIEDELWRRELEEMTTDDTVCDAACTEDILDGYG
jgi:hypothetical protein